MSSKNSGVLERLEVIQVSWKVRGHSCVLGSLGVIQVSLKG